MTRYSSVFAMLALSAGLALASAGASAQMHAHDAMAGATRDDPAALSVGEVKKVDRDSGKLTIKHGPLNNLDMPGMTMVFKVQDPAMLDRVKAGDAIRFRAERINDALTVTRIETTH